MGLRFYAAIKGSVEVLGVSVGQADEHWLHQQIAYVPQEPTVFTETLRDNLLMSRPDADSSFVEGVSTTVGGYDAEIGSHGTTPSAGQRQLLPLPTTLPGRPKETRSQ